MMNAAHLHLVLNHFPVIGSAIAIFVLIIGILKKSDEIKKTGAMIIVLTSLITIPVYFSGENAQAKIEGNYEDVDEEFVEPHEDFAFYSFIAMDIAGIFALGSLLMFRKQKPLPNSVTYLLLIVLLIVKGMMAYTANLGGKIHHPEIREDKLPWESGTGSVSIENKSDKNNKAESESDSESDSKKESKKETEKDDD
ncbi:MAG TPA: hypothetical protein PKA90_09180 [Ignavibacteria bacterium]|nr:hypothetical protein [Ignavibacteria bacterium]HMR40588.1 hypothetical protein [Ignavibacteria bacterium]